MGTHEHSRVHFLILALVSGSRILQPSLHVGIWKPRPEFATSNSFRKMCVLLGAGGRSRGGGRPFPKMWPPLNRVGAEFIGVTRKERPCLLQNVALTALDTKASRWFIGGTRKERRCFAAECSPDPFGHTQALEGPFSDPRIRAPSTKSSWGRPCFAAERGLHRLGHRSLRMVYWGHTKGMALFCCRMRPRPLGAHTSARGSIF